MATKKFIKQEPLFIHSIKQLSQKFSELIDFEFAEIRSMLAASLLLAIILSFNQWGITQFDFWVGIKNLIIAFIAVTISYFAHHKAHKIVANNNGAEIKYKSYPRITAFAFVIGIFTRFLFTTMGEFEVISTKKLIGKEKKAGPLAIGYIALAGIFANVILIIIAKILIQIFGKNIFLQDIFIFNIWMSLISFIPIILPPVQRKEFRWVKDFLPPFDGARIFFAGYMSYILAAGFTIPLILSLIYFPIIASIILAIFAAIIITAYYLWHFNKKVEPD